MDVVRLGLVGCGNMGQSLINQAVTLEQATLTVVADVDPDRAAEVAAKFDAIAVADVAAMVARDDVDAVVVATPGGFHRPPVETAIAAGKHVFCEKPLAARLTDADAMVAAAEAAGIKAMVGQVCRYHPCHRTIKRMVTDGTLGPVQSMYVERLGGGWGDKHPAWRHSRELAGGNLLEINAHELDFMLWLGGEVTSVSSVGGLYHDQRLDFPDLTFVSLNFASGTVGVLQSSAITTLGSYAGRFDCEAGSAIVPKLFGGPITYALRDGSGNQEVTPEQMQGEVPVKAEMRAFVDSIINDEEPPVTFRQARQVVAVAEAAYESIETGQTVKLA